jgi:hypothetical protein
MLIWNDACMQWYRNHCEHENIVQLSLQRRDIRVNLKQGRGETALIYNACKVGQEGIVELLLEREDIDTRLKNKITRDVRKRLLV